MKPRPLALTFALAVALAFDAAYAATERWELPSQKTGTGSHDFYNLGAKVGDEPAVYYIAVAAHKKFDLVDVAATTGDTTLALGDKDNVKALGGLVKSQVIMLLPTREQMERAAESGMPVKITSKRGGMVFSIPAVQFATMLRDADKHDRYRPNAAMKALGGIFDADRVATYLEKGSGRIHGQAFLKTRGGEVRLGAGNVITLVPDDDWTRRAMELLKEGASLDELPEAAKQYLARVMHTTQGDAGGNFTFEALPQGIYRLETVITWLAGRYSTGGLVTRRVVLADGQDQQVMLTE